MTKEDRYGKLIQAISKEQLSEMIKDTIRKSFPEPFATLCCQQFDDAKKLADFLDLYAKYVRENRL